MNSWMSSCNSAHMANNLMRWWRSKFYKGYKPFTVDTAESPISDSEDLLGRKNAEYQISSCTTPPLNPHLSTTSLPLMTDLHSTVQNELPRLNLQEFSCNVALADVPSETLKDRQEFSFTLYDFDGHGKITRDDIAGLVTTIYKALGSSIKVPHCGSKTIKVKLTVSPDQRKHVSTSVMNSPTVSEENPEQKLNFNVTIKRVSSEKKNNRDLDNKKHYCCKKLNEDGDVSDDYSDACSRMSAEVTAAEEECDPSDEFMKQKHNDTKTQSGDNKKECDVKKHGKSFLHTKKVKKRNNRKEDIHAGTDCNNASFYTSRKLDTVKANVENSQPFKEIKYHRHRHHRENHSHNSTPFRCLANVDQTHFYVDLMALQNNTQLSSGHCQYDKLMDAVMCVSNKKFSECCKRHNFKNCDGSNNPFHCQIEDNANSTKHTNKPVKRHAKKQNDFEFPNVGKKNIRKLPRVVLGHTSSPHHLRHRNRQEDQARAMAQVVRWLEQEFSNNLYTNMKEEKTETTNCEANNKEHPCGMSKNQNYYTEYHEHHHVHEHIHHHYHHYQESSVGTLRPKTINPVTGSMLNDLLDRIATTVRGNVNSLSNIHSVNQITSGLFLGDKYAAKDKKFLLQHGFTHVVNAAEGIDEHQVNTNQYYYTPLKIKYLGIPGHDRPSWNISVYFDQAARFIDNAIKSGGKVLVHCVVGISRSATLVIAYLMIFQNMDAAEALQFVFRRRRVFPNIGFLHHLAHLNTILASKRTARYSRR